ncbi:hypothetical protein METSCH_D00220 [Metschnikowia aff. pulcherrima]|uniref:Uncharacterized protein n=1 Tax=Metschnikowia aff. pulcherrima TaxID=2163413 RepID=A0A4P6XQI1_9ASCO|nr:hypothetical protein METSCH_D00220 [Metschnikowia aff. pulcherrima]
MGIAARIDFTFLFRINKVLFVMLKIHYEIAAWHSNHELRSKPLTLIKANIVKSACFFFFLFPNQINYEWFFDARLRFWVDRVEHKFTAGTARTAYLKMWEETLNAN